MTLDGLPGVEHLDPIGDVGNAELNLIQQVVIVTETAFPFGC